MNGTDRDAFPELHAASAFSFLRGGSSPEAMARRAGEAGLGAMALCDRDGVYGAPRFHKACREQGVRPLVGAELTLGNGAAVPVIAVSRTGYENLCQLITGGQLASPKGGTTFDLESAARFAEGLVALTGDADEGVFAGLAPDAWPEALDRLRRAFPGAGQLYVELNHHRRRGDPRRMRALSDLAESRGLPVVAANAPRHATRRERAVADVFTCLRHRTHLDAAGRLLSRNAERHVKAGPEMRELFRDFPAAVENARELARRAEFSLANLGYEFPRYKVAEGETMEGFLRKIAWFGAEQRYGGLTPKIRRQLEHELDVIGRLGFAGYFLIVRDIVNDCRERGVMVQGRGSAANSAVCYSLGITAVDPLECGLLFERFLNEARQGWPDIDLDLPSGERRESVIQNVYERYGPRGAAMTANVITYRGRGAIREIGKALNFPRALIDRFSSLCANGDYPQTLELREQLEQAGIRPDHPRAPALAGLCEMIRGLPRHLGQHSGGMIVCEGALDRVVPLENASMPGRVVAQWDKEDCEDLGIVKVDLLGLGMMAVLQDALDLTRRRGRPVDLARIPKDDPATFACMRAADTIGVFQIESRAQQATLPRMRPACFYDVAIEVAIVRPGPIQGDLVHPYLARRQGREAADPIDERLRPVLERTLGVPLFQEQMLQIAMIMADFDGVEADELRRALNFHRSPERLERARAKMRDAMERKGVEPGKIETILKAAGSFALYGFPESHAISFALLAYASAYLKTHYSEEFYCALLNNQPMGFYSPATLVQDAKRHGLRFRAPCVARSEHGCSVEDEATIRLGLQWVRGLSERGARAVLEARSEGAFASLDDFRRRAGLGEAELRRLGLAGALNAFAGNRRSALWEVAEPREDDLLAGVGDDAPAGSDGPDPPLEAMDRLERIQADYASLGLTAGRHPMALIRPRTPELWRAGDLPEARNGRRVEVGGAVICRQRPGTAKGFVFVCLEDETGIANAVLEPDFFEKRRLLLTQEPFLRIRGRLQNLDGVIHVRADYAAPLGDDALPEEASHDFR